MRHNLYYFRFLLCISSTLCINCLYAQVHKTNNAKESLKIAQELITNQKFDKAVKQLVHTIEIKEDLAVAHRLLGRVYYELKDYENACLSLERSFLLDRKLSRAALFECGDAHMQNGDTEKANYFFKQFADMKNERYANAKKEEALEKSYEELVLVKQDNIAYIESLDKVNVSTKIVALTKINSSKNEYLPSLSNDGSFLLFTRNLNGKQEDIYLSQKTENGWADENTRTILINTKNNEGMAKFEPHNYKVYYAGCSRRSEKVDCDIFESEFIDGKLSTEKSLVGELNSPYWDSQPAVSCDGRKMYFASTRKGGFGGSDIWMSVRNELGEWGEATNLGESINTAGDEEAPFIAKDHSTLYFTSDTHPGQGEGDFFVSFFEAGTWGKPNNLGYPINSPSKELGLYISDDTETVYFSSERVGGKGGLDIYKAALPAELRPKEVVPVVLKLVDAHSQKAIQGIITVGFEKSREAHETDLKGNVQLCLVGGKAYSFRVEKEGYDFFIEAVYVENILGEEIQNIKLALKKNGATDPLPVFEEPLAEEKIEFDADEPIAEVEPIEEKEPYQGEERHTKSISQVFFGSNSSKIEEEYKNKLERFAALINKYDDWKIVVTGYIDSAGDQDSGEMLSSARTQAVIDYLAQFCNKPMQQNSKLIKESKQASGVAEGKKKSRRIDIILTR